MPISILENDASRTKQTQEGRIFFLVHLVTEIQSIVFANIAKIAKMK